MGSGYRHVPQGPQAVAARMRSLQTQLAAARRQSSSASLHSPYSPVTVNDSTPNIQLLSWSGSAAQENVPVPDGFTAATLLMTVAIEGTRDGSTGGVNAISIQAYADVLMAPIITRTFAAAGTQGYIPQSFAATLSGLSGQFSMGALASGSSGWVAGSGVGHLSALVVFVR